MSPVARAVARSGQGHDTGGDDDCLSPPDLNRLCRLIHERSGINIGVDKKVMLEGRLKRRLRGLELSSLSEYCEYLFGGGHQSAEIVHLIDAVSTNKTDFFREKHHLDVLAAQVLPEITARSGRRELRIWSAGCSSGEEPYSLAIILSEYAQSHPGFRFRVLATDISTAMLARAKRAIFTAEAVSPVPAHLRRKYFMRSRDRKADLQRVVPELRATIEFRYLNLMEDFGLPEPVDAIFCRNVVIYFDRPTQQRLFRKFGRQLVDGGYLFVGHSESLQRLDVPFIPISPALYRKADGPERK